MSLSVGIADTKTIFETVDGAKRERGQMTSWYAENVLIKRNPKRFGYAEKKAVATTTDPIKKEEVKQELINEDSQPKEVKPKRGRKSKKVKVDEQGVSE